MDIRLNRLELKNFKGVKDYRLEIEGKNATVKGNNGVGKTTQYDAFLWLLFDKDSANNAKFSVKPQDKNGNEIHFLETSVEAELFVDGKPLKLKKVLTENWVKPRGKEEQEYKGNETTYFFDEVPVKKSEYQRKIAELIDEETFKLITNPLYFNDDKAFPWDKRRRKLFEMCGTLTDEEIIASTPKLADLPGILDGKSVEDRTVIIKSSIKKLNEQIEQIGPKINENLRLIPEKPVDYSETEQELAGLKAELAEIEKQMSDATSIVSRYQEKQRQLYVLKGKQQQIKARLDEEANSGRMELLREKQKVADDKYMLEGRIKTLKQSIEYAKSQIALKEQERQQLLAQYKELNAEKQDIMAWGFAEPDENNFNCPTCGQPLPDEAKEQKLAELRTRFEQNKERELQRVITALQHNINQGQACKATIQALQGNITENEAIIDECEIKLQELSARLEEIETMLSQPVATVNYIENPEYAEIGKQISELEAELSKPIEDTTAELREKKIAIQDKIDRCNYILNNKKVAENAKARIEELKKEEKELSAQKSKLEGQLFKLEEFIRTKAELLSEAVNRRFKHVRFKLFEEQINGGLKETCETLVNTNGSWVPYSDGNTAGKMNAGLDIIDALIEYSNVSAPLFIDNAEAVTDILPVNAQMIKLVKPEIRTEEEREKYSKLVVEVEE